MDAFRRGLILAGLGGLAGAASAQLSSPVPGVAPVAPAAPGQGGGFHSPDSPFEPLRPRADVLAWSLLSDVETRVAGGRVEPVFRAGQEKLNDKVQRVQGFMMPLEPGERQRHFLLTSVPMTCAFCVPGGPESMVEVRTREQVRYTLEPVVVQGRFLVLRNDSYGLYYRLLDAVGVK